MSRALLNAPSRSLLIKGERSENSVRPARSEKDCGSLAMFGKRMENVSTTV